MVNGGITEHGSVSLSPSADEVSFVYTPDSNYSGADRFVVMVEVPNPIIFMIRLRS